jgi:hypothetical protein
MVLANAFSNKPFEHGGEKGHQAFSNPCARLE